MNGSVISTSYNWEESSPVDTNKELQYPAFHCNLISNSVVKL